MLKLNLRPGVPCSLLKQSYLLVINLIGLAVSFFSYFIDHFVSPNELSYIWSVSRKCRSHLSDLAGIVGQQRESGVSFWAHTSLLWPYLNSDFQEVDDVVRLINNGNSLVSYNQKSNVETRLFFIADPSVFIFLKVIMGNKSTALKMWIQSPLVQSSDRSLL